MAEKTRTSWLPLAAVSIGIFLVANDGVQLPVGAPAIAADLGTNVGGIQAAIAIQSLVAAPLYIAGAKLGDRFGKKTIFLAGMILYGIGSLGAALAPNLGIFIVGWSVIRALGMVTSIPAGVGLLIATYDGGQRGKAFSIYGVAGVLAALVAPLYMGFAAQELTWRLPLFTIAAMAGLAFLLALRVNETARDTSLSIDWSGTLVFGLGVASIIMSGMLGTRYGWWEARRPFEIGDVTINPFGLSPAPTLMLVGTLLFGVSISWFLGKSEAGGSPLFDPRLFRNETYAPTFPMATLLFLLSGALPFTVPVFLQAGVGFDPSTAGLVMVAFSIGSMALGFLSGRLLEHLEARSLMLITIVVLAVGLAWLALAVEPDVTYWGMALPMVVIGAAFGVISSQAPNIQMSALSPEQVGEGSGLAEVGKEIGIGLGTAVIGGVLLSSALGFTIDSVARSSEIELTLDQREAVILEIEDLGGIDGLAEAELPAEDKAAIGAVVPQAYSDGMKIAIGGMFLVVVGALAFASFLPRVRPEDVTDEAKDSVAPVRSRRT